LGISIDSDAAQLIAGASRSTPRIGNRLMRSVRDFAQMQSHQRIASPIVRETLKSLDIDYEGLDATDRLMLSTIIDTFNGGPVGLSTLAAILAEEEETIEDMYEPFLMQQGYIQRTPKGRMATKKAYEKIGRELPENLNAQLPLM
jgi:holliday junction DNA helicase RuvB